jgi:hypothetical protein
VESVLLPAHAQTSPQEEPDEPLPCGFVACRARPNNSNSNDNIDAEGGVPGSGTWCNTPSNGSGNQDVLQYRAQISCDGEPIEGVSIHLNVRRFDSGDTEVGFPNSGDGPADFDSTTDAGGIANFNPPGGFGPPGFFGNQDETLIATFSFNDSDLSDETCEITINFGSNCT